jgi:hypothetical protein
MTVVFVLWVTIAGVWFKGPTYINEATCHHQAEAVAAAGVKTVCAPL